MIEIIAKIFLVVGAFFSLVGSIGIIRMPDVYNRIHSETIVVVGGTVLLMIGVIILKGFSLFSLKALLIAIFLFVTNPVSSHALARSAHKSKAELWSGTLGDKLEEEEE